MARFKQFNKNNFIRTSGGITWETREVQPSDFTTTQYGYAHNFPIEEYIPGSSYNGKTKDCTYAEAYAISPYTFDLIFPNWQNFADYFIMRRPVYRITGKQECATESFKANDMAEFEEADKVNVKNFKIPGGFQGNSIPSGKWLNMGMTWTDRGDTTTVVTVEYEQRGEWKLIKIQDGNPPDPK